ncbi:CU044_5270 family protein [Thermopolyspora sp. NPDC052614]|uniref:CU044_5270 family protein n=1 Tax=Thermopolyspora sp. NPDC052614 TaxID=3155682 RepID=UPI00341B9A18
MIKQDEIQLVADIRPEAEPYDPTARADARRRLTRTIYLSEAAANGSRPRRRFFTVAVAGAMAGALALAVAAATTQIQRNDPAGVVAAPTGTSPRGVVSLKLSKVSAEEVLDKAANAATDELRPRDDQFIVVETQSMNGVESGGGVDQEGKRQPETHWLYRSKRTIWQPADNSRDVVVKEEHLDPLPYPGWPIPQEAYRDRGKTEVFPVTSCGTPTPTHYTALKRLPTDPERMRDWLYNGSGDQRRTDEEAWSLVGELLEETYMPPAQRAALFKAAAGIPGVTVMENVEDAAGRVGIAAGRPGELGIRTDLIFDSKTYELLGERGVVVDAEAAKAPVGSLVASTAQLKISVADSAPDVDRDFEESACPS